MDVLSLKEMVVREDEAFHYGMTPAALMEAAGEAMAWRITDIYPHARKFLIVVGKGNNGGDGLVVARYLSELRRTVRVVLTAPDDELGELPQRRPHQPPRPLASGTTDDARLEERCLLQ